LRGEPESKEGAKGRFRFCFRSSFTGARYRGSTASKSASEADVRVAMQPRYHVFCIENEEIRKE
jgi:hypothetical protein